MNIAVYSKYRPEVDEYESVTVHDGVTEGLTFCGRDVSKFSVRETSKHPVDCKRCLAAMAKKGKR